MKIGIIGGGASGMMAAVTAAEQPDHQVLLFERQFRVGKKLLATGNGRCNLTNLHTGDEFYHGASVSFSAPALKAFPPEKTLEFFQSHGLLTVTEPSGRVYPYSDQANSVVDVLRFALSRSNIQVETSCEVMAVKLKTANSRLKQRKRPLMLIA